MPSYSRCASLGKLLIMLNQHLPRSLMSKIRYRMGRIIQTWFFVFLLTPALWADEPASIKPPTPSGETVYQYSCAICHGADGEAVMPGVPDLTGNPDMLNQADAILIRKISQGFQSPGSSLAMPANGGNPQLNENDIRRVLNYMRQTFQ